MRFIISLESIKDNPLLSNIENYDFPLWKVNVIVISLIEILRTDAMNNEKVTLSKEEAAAILKSVDSTKRDAIKSFRIPLLLVTLISLSYSLVVFSWGMTEHDNLWALGMYIGRLALVYLSLSIYIPSVCWE